MAQLNSYGYSDRSSQALALRGNEPAIGTLRLYDVGDTITQLLLLGGIAPVPARIDASAELNVPADPLIVLSIRQDATGVVLDVEQDAAGVSLDIEGYDE